MDGPQRVFVAGKKFQNLYRYSADQKQYIRVQSRDGNIEHMPGYVLYKNTTSQDYSQ